MDEIKINDRQCPICNEIGSGLLFFVEHWHNCNVDSEDMTEVIDVEYELVNLLEEHE